MRRSITWVAAALIAVAATAGPANASSSPVTQRASSCSVISSAMGNVYLWNDLVKKWTQLAAQAILLDEDPSEYFDEIDKSARYVTRYMTQAFKASKNASTRALLRSGIRYAQDADGPGVDRIYAKVMGNLDRNRC